MRYATLAMLPLSVLLTLSNAHAAYGSSPAPDAADRAACASVAPENRADCLYEAGAARQAERTGQLTSGNAADYERNATARCTAFKEEGDRADCAARLRNDASTTGSVEGGGILREATTPIAPR